MTNEQLYIVIDTKGSGRVLGVFNRRELAAKIVDRFPHYYKMHQCRLNQINAEVLDWADDDAQRRFLAQFEQGTDAQ